MSYGGKSVSGVNVGHEIECGVNYVLSFLKQFSLCSHSLYVSKIYFQNFPSVVCIVS